MENLRNFQGNSTPTVGKAILDACKGYLVHDDDQRYVTAVHHTLWKGGAIKVTVREADL